MTFKYTTLARMRRVFRDKFRDEQGLRRLKAAKWLIENCNNTQLQNVFNLATLADAQALRVRLQNKVDKLTAYEASLLAVNNQDGE